MTSVLDLVLALSTELSEVVLPGPCVPVFSIGSGLLLCEQSVRLETGRPRDCEKSLQSENGM